jgi:biopolymer transport protein TolR
MKKHPKKIFIKSASGSNGDINVTPLVDVVLVLLIIFMVVTPLLEKDIPLSMPSTEKVEDVREVPPDQLVVHIAPNGDLKINSDAVTPEEYVAKLKAKLDTKGPSDKIVFIVADDTANYARLVAALDGAKRAGATTLGMASENPDQAGGSANK